MRAKILDEAKKCVIGGREQDYGSPENNFSMIGRLWSVYLEIEITPKDVAIMMTLLKIARAKDGRFKLDNYIDACGYLACAGEIENEKEITVTV